MNQFLDHPVARDTTLLLVRVMLGVVFIAHGWQKVFITRMGGNDGVIAQFTTMGIPQPKLSAWAVAIVEMGGGALLVTGLLAPLAAGMLLLEMCAAIYFAHWGQGIFAAEGGWELPAILATSLMVVIVFGSGRASLDRVFSRFG